MDVVGAKKCYRRGKLGAKKCSKYIVLSAKKCVYIMERLVYQDIIKWSKNKERKPLILNSYYIKS
jgi:hypothetical protein